MELVMENKNIIILGDFNMHINNPNDVDANILLDTLEVVGFQQHRFLNSSTWKHSGSIIL